MVIVHVFKSYAPTGRYEHRTPATLRQGGHRGEEVDT